MSAREYELREQRIDEILRLRTEIARLQQRLDDLLFPEKKKANIPADFSVNGAILDIISSSGATGIAVDAIDATFQQTNPKIQITRKRISAVLSYLKSRNRIEQIARGTYRAKTQTTSANEHTGG